MASLFVPSVNLELHDQETTPPRIDTSIPSSVDPSKALNVAVKVADDFAAYAQQVQEKEDNANAQDAINKLDESIQNLQTDLSNSGGEDAQKLYSNFSKRLQELKKINATGLNGRALEKYNEKADSVLSVAGANGYAIHAKQTTDWNRDLATAALYNANQKAIASYGTPLFEKNMEEVNGYVKALAAVDHKDSDPKLLEMAYRKNSSDLYKGLISAQITMGNLGNAGSALKQYGAKMDQMDVVQLNAQLAERIRIESEKAMARKSSSVKTHDDILKDHGLSEAEKIQAREDFVEANVTEVMKANGLNINDQKLREQTRAGLESSNSFVTASYKAVEELSKKLYLAHSFTAQKQFRTEQRLISAYNNVMNHGTDEEKMHLQIADNPLSVLPMNVQKSFIDEYRDDKEGYETVSANVKRALRPDFVGDENLFRELKRQAINGKYQTLNDTDTSRLITGYYGALNTTQLNELYDIIRYSQLKHQGKSLDVSYISNQNIMSKIIFGEKDYKELDEDQKQVVDAGMHEARNEAFKRIGDNTDLAGINIAIMQLLNDPDFLDRLNTIKQSQQTALDSVGSEVLEKAERRREAENAFDELDEFINSKGTDGDGN